VSICLRLRVMDPTHRASVVGPGPVHRVEMGAVVSMVMGNGLPVAIQFQFAPAVGAPWFVGHGTSRGDHVELGLFIGGAAE